MDARASVMHMQAQQTIWVRYLSLLRPGPVTHADKASSCTHSEVSYTGCQYRPSTRRRLLSCLVQHLLNSLTSRLSCCCLARAESSACCAASSSAAHLALSASISCCCCAASSALRWLLLATWASRSLPMASYCSLARLLSSAYLSGAAETWNMQLKGHVVD